MTDKELVRYAREFRDGILGKRKAWRACWMVCAPLQGLLAFEGIQTKLVEGTVDHNGRYQHFWLQLTDGRVLDPTADQFNAIEGLPKMPKVWLGHPSDIHQLICSTK